MQTPGSCPKCGGSLAQGFTIDNTYGGKGIGTWHPGAPQKSFWTGLRVDRRELRDIQSWRCNRCGYLEQYAR